jgi:CTP:molybdopterin cytidylyltransferase MocA
MRPIAIILAAGRGERLGGPKALLAWPAAGAAGTAKPERPLAIAHAEARLDAECGRALVIARQPVVKVLLRYVRPGIDLLASAADDVLGPAGSLAVAAARLGDAEEIVVTPADAPPARADTVARLLERLRGGQPALLAVRPRYNGRRGHPVVMRAEVLARYLEPSPPPLRDHLRALGEQCADEDVDDPAVLVDLDRPLDVLRWTGGPPRFLG